MSTRVDDGIVERLRIAVKRAGGNKATAEKAGVGLGTVNNYVRGVNAVSAVNAGKLAAACGVSVDWLINGTATTPQVAENADAPQDGEFLRRRFGVVINGDGGIAETSKITGISIARLQSYLDGSRPITLTDAVTLVRARDISLDFLAAGVTNSPATYCTISDRLHKAVARVRPDMGGNYRSDAALRADLDFITDDIVVLARVIEHEFNVRIPYGEENAWERVSDVWRSIQAANVRRLQGC